VSGRPQGPKRLITGSQYSAIEEKWSKKRDHGEEMKRRGEEFLTIRRARRQDLSRRGVLGSSVLSGPSENSGKLGGGSRCSRQERRPGGKQDGNI